MNSQWLCVGCMSCCGSGGGTFRARGVRIHVPAIVAMARRDLKGKNSVTELRLVVSRHSAFYSPFISTIAGGFLEKEGLSGTYAVAPAGSNSPRKWRQARRTWDRPRFLRHGVRSIGVKYRR